MNWKFYTEPPHAWDAMYEACREAKSSIRVEQFIIKPDDVGMPFLKLLAAKAADGIDVKVIVDTAGSFEFYASFALVADLEKQGVQIQFFNPIDSWRTRGFLRAIFFRDHRKLLIVDSQIAFTGSLGYEVRFAPWRETMVKVEGGVTQGMADYFDDLWNHIKVRKPWRPHAAAPYGEFQFIHGIPLSGRRELYRRLLDAIRNTQKELWLVTPYFIPNPPLFRELRKSARRGVDVKLMVSGESDHSSIDHASHSFFKRALKSGIKIYAHQNRNIHAKTAVCDDAVGFVGSSNLDNLSMFLNHEGALVSTNAEFVAELRKQFTDDLGNCLEVKLKEWEQRSLAEKVMELCTMPFHWWM